MRPAADVVSTSSTQLGIVAVGLFDAEAAFLRAEAGLESLLDSLYGEWCWNDMAFDHREVRLDVYGVVPSDAVAEALHLAGFAIVVQHEHQLREFTKCACQRHRRAR